MLRIAALALLTIIPVSIAPRTASSPAPQSPKQWKARALVLLGGEYHAVETNTRAVMDIVNKSSVEFTDIQFVRIDEPPQGKPAAEKATIVRNPDILKDPDLGKKFDIIFQYTQDSYIKKLDSDHVDGILNFVRTGGSWIGWHCASDTFKQYPEYVKMVGGRFETHPAYGEIQVQRVATTSEIAGGVGDFTVRDELYHLADSTAAGKDLILVAKSPGDGKTRPVAWTRRYGMGKVFYTTLGHGPDVYKTAEFQQLMIDAANWCAFRGNGAMDGDATILFNNSDLDGWTMSGPGRFILDKGAIVTVGGMGMLWYEKRAFRDFVLELDWSVSRKEDNSGVFVRFPAPWNPWTAVNKGYEIQIGDPYDDKHNTGSIYDFKGPSKLNTKPVGEWNHYKIEVRGQKYVIYINDEKVNEFEGNRSSEGHIGLQNHDKDSHVRFRNIRVTELR